MKENKIKINFLKNYTIVFMLAMGGVSVSWFTVFDLKPAGKLDVQDIVIEGLVLLLILTAHIYIFRLKIGKLQLGWSILAIGRLIDLFDEFTSEPEFFDTTMEGLLVISSLALTVRGFYEAYLSLKDEIEARKKNEKCLLRIREIQKCVTDVLETIVFEKDRDKLFRQTCQILIRARYYRFAWIGLVKEGTKKVMPAAHAGFEKGYLDNITVTWDRAETGRGPTGTAIKTGKPSIIKDTGSDPFFEPWRREAQKRNFASVAAVPLLCRNNIFGALTVYSAYPDAFDSEEIELLQILARSLAYAYNTLEIEEKRKEAERALKKSEKHYRTLVEALGEGVVVTDLDNKIQYVNPAICSLLGYKKSELIGRNFEDFIPPSQWSKIKEHNRLRLKGENSSYELQIITRSGDNKIVRITGVPIKDDTGQAITTLGVVSDVTQVKELENKLLRQAREDALTGLYNRFYFNERIKEEIERAARYEHNLTFIMIDIDNFKEINDRFSHLMGDKVLKEVGGVLKACVRESDLAFRYGGDEFLLVLPETSSKEAQQLVKRIQKKVKIAQKNSRFGKIEPILSFGIATWEPGSGKKWEEVLKESDLKMYQEKMKKK